MSGRLENDSFKLLDTVVSMNGFHAFPDKQKAFHEIWRVLKPGGNFIAHLDTPLLCMAFPA
jgi:ubiquinone/menaquinone biosynthesis C-methylase UbiE